MTSRRGFLKLGLAGATGALLSPLLSRVSAQRDAKLVIALAYGGWDPTWTVDPKPDSAEVDRIPGDVQTFGELPIWTHESRPQVTDFFERWGSLSAVINGVAVESLAHETCIDVALTGRAGGATPDLAARIAAARGGARALPYLALSPQAEVDGLEAHVGTFGATNQLMALANPAFGWPATTSTQPDTALELGPNERAMVRAWLEGSTEHLRALHGGSPRTDRVVDDYASSLGRMHRLWEAASSGGMFSDASLFEETENPFRHVAAALAEGVAQTAIVQPNLYWDTHSYNSGQNDAHNDFFGGLDGLLSDLYERDALDDTVVLVLSEMGRTPLHNATDGKDHWPWTSAMLIGTGIQGGRAFGETDEWLRPKPIDLQSGALSEAGTIVHAEHVLHAASAALGVESSNWFERAPLRAVVGASS